MTMDSENIANKAVPNVVQKSSDNKAVDAEKPTIEVEEHTAEPATDITTSAEENPAPSLITPMSQDISKLIKIQTSSANAKAVENDREDEDPTEDAPKPPMVSEAMPVETSIAQTLLGVSTSSSSSSASTPTAAAIKIDKAEHKGGNNVDIDDEDDLGKEDDDEDDVPVKLDEDAELAKKNALRAAVAAAEARQAAIDSGAQTKGSGRWTKAEDESLKLAVKQVGARNWKRIASEYLADTRTDVQCLHRWQKVLRPGLVKGPWQPEEDDEIRRCIANGITRWSEIAMRVPGRIGKQCRERWFNHLDPSIKHGEWTEEEDRLLIEGQRALGNKWSQIAKHYLPGRPENAVKNRWNAATRRHRTVNAKESSAKVRAAEVAARAAEAAAAAVMAQVNSSGGSAIDALTLAASTMKASATKRTRKTAGEGKTATPKRPRKETQATTTTARRRSGPKKAKLDQPVMNSLISLCNAALDDKASQNDGEDAKKGNKTRGKRGASFSASRPHLTTPASIDTNGRNPTLTSLQTSSKSVVETPLWKSPRMEAPSSISPNKPPEKEATAPSLTSLQILSQMVSSKKNSKAVSEAIASIAESS